jgi:PAS domain-containing protein
MGSDIDDRKRAEDELRRKEAFLTEGERLNATGSFCWRVDADELTISEQLRRIYGFERDTPVTLELIRTRVHPEDAPLLAEKVELARRGVNDHRYDLRLLMPDGSTRYLRTNSRGTRGRYGRLEYVGAVQEVTFSSLLTQTTPCARA